MPVFLAYARESGNEASANTPLGNAFAYQGRLVKDGIPADGAFDFEFRLWDQSTGGTQVGNPISAPSLLVTNGLFSISLDFGLAFSGSERFLEVRVRPATDEEFELLGPRQLLAATPYALYAKSIPLGGDGLATTAARSDHTHLGESWMAAQGDGLLISTSAGRAVNASTTGAGGVLGSPASGSLGRIGVTGWVGIGICSLTTPSAGVFGSACGSEPAVLGFSNSGDAIVGTGGTGKAGVVGIARAGLNQNWGVYSSGNLGVDGTVFSASDAHLKQDITAVQSSLALVQQLRPVRYDWIATEEREADYGFTAQDVAAIFPDLVTEGADGHLMLNYLGLIPILTRALQEQQAEIDALRASLR